MELTVNEINKIFLNDTVITDIITYGSKDTKIDYNKSEVFKDGILYAKNYIIEYLLSKEIVVTENDYKEWLQLRLQSKNADSEKLCYCGHTYKCTCPNPNFTDFKDAVKNKFIKLGSPTNGWK